MWYTIKLVNLHHLLMSTSTSSSNVYFSRLYWMILSWASALKREILSLFLWEMSSLKMHVCLFLRHTAVSIGALISGGRLWLYLLQIVAKFLIQQWFGGMMMIKSINMFSWSLICFPVTNYLSLLPILSLLPVVYS